MRRILWAKAVRFPLALMAAVLLCAGCGLNQRADTIAAKGEELKRWRVDEEIRLIVREANRITMYRVYDMGGFEGSGVRAESVYAVDTTTRTCYAGQVQAPLPCESLARDPDMQPYVTPLLSQHPAPNLQAPVTQ